MGSTYDNESALRNSRADTRTITLVSGSATISQSPKRVGMVIFSPVSNPIRITIGLSSDPGYGGIVLSPGDAPAFLRLLDYGDALRETVILTGTGSDSVLITELTDCPCVKV